MPAVARENAGGPRTTSRYQRQPTLHRSKPVVANPPPCRGLHGIGARIRTIVDVCRDLHGMSPLIRPQRLQQSACRAEPVINRAQSLQKSAYPCSESDPRSHTVDNTHERRCCAGHSALSERGPLVDRLQAATRDLAKSDDGQAFIAALLIAGRRKQPGVLQREDRL